MSVHHLPRQELLFAPALPYAPTAQVSVCRKDGRATRHELDSVAEEVAVALEYNGVSHAVMLATPADLEDFALGFSLGEGLIHHRSELYECDVVPGDNGIRVAMRISGERFAQMKQKRRNLTGRTGCGLCGTESLEQVVRVPAPVQSSARVDPEGLQQAFWQMEQLQALQQCTGATHGAGWLRADGHVDLVREDVGRHNALDKLIGALNRRNTDVSTGIALITSRASYEMVQKAAAAGIGILAAISAPTALAIRLADAAGVTLIGFVRRDQYVIYTNAYRVRHPDLSLEAL